MKHFLFALVIIVALNKKVHSQPPIHPVVFTPGIPIVMAPINAIVAGVPYLFKEENHKYSFWKSFVYSSGFCTLGFLVSSFTDSDEVMAVGIIGGTLGGTVLGYYQTKSDDTVPIVLSIVPTKKKSHILLSFNF
ncbi:MAG: hypothetical protein OCD01_10255 [Fibrobacterales bacterium]